MEQKTKPRQSNQSSRLQLLLSFILGVGVTTLAFGLIMGTRSNEGSEIPEVITVQLPITITSSPTDDNSPTPRPTQGYRCTFTWGYGSISDEAEEKIRTALDEAGYEDAKLETKANGEDEVCREGDEIVSAKFLLMNFTPTVIMDVDSETLYNKTAIAGMVRDIAPILINLEDIPRIGNIEVGFLNLSEEYLLWSASLQDITTALDNEIDDSALYDLGVPEN